MPKNESCENLLDEWMSIMDNTRIEKFICWGKMFVINALWKKKKEAKQRKSPDC